MDFLFSDIPANESFSEEKEMPLDRLSVENSRLICERTNGNRNRFRAVLFLGPMA